MLRRIAAVVDERGGDLPEPAEAIGDMAFAVLLILLTILLTSCGLLLFVIFRKLDRVEKAGVRYARGREGRILAMANDPSIVDDVSPPPRSRLRRVKLLKMPSMPDLSAPEWMLNWGRRPRVQEERGEKSKDPDARDAARALNVSRAERSDRGKAAETEMKCLTECGAKMSKDGYCEVDLNA